MRVYLQTLSFASATLVFFLFLPLQLAPTSIGISRVLAQAAVGEGTVLPDSNDTTSDRQAEADRLFQEGTEQFSNRQYQAALQTYQQVLAISREISDREGEGETLHKIGATYDRLGEYSQALEFYQQALSIRQALGDRAGVGSTLNSIGGIYHQQGSYQQALEFYQQTLAIRREVGDQPGEGRTLNNIGLVYNQQGQYPRALEFYQQALDIFKSLDNRLGVGAILNNMGLVHTELGEYDQSLKLYQQSLEVRREIGDQTGVGTSLHNIGFVYNQLNEHEQALDFYQQALAVRREVGDKAGEATTLNNIGFVNNQLGKHDQALASLEQALSIFQEIGDKAGEGYTLDSIGTAYKSLGDYAKSLQFYQQALAILREVGDRPSERITLSNIGSLLQQDNQSELAIVFYKQSVNLTESIRKDLRVLSSEQQQSYTQTVADTYRRLADLLLQQNRVIEAQRVLDLLKLQELDDYLGNVRGNEQTTQGIGLLSLEQPIWDGIDTILNDATQQQITEPLDEFIESPDVVALVQQLNQKAKEQRLDLTYLDILQGSLRKLETRAVLLYPLILEDRLELVLITPNAPPIRRTVPVKREDLNHAIVEFLDALTIPRQTLTVKPAQKSGRQLYDWLIKPIENELAQANAQTIIYAPDGQLRYIPLAALYDGNQWLIERYEINNITAASLIDFKPQLATQPRVLAAAFSQGHYEFQLGTYQFVFSGLEFAGREVENIAAEIPNTTKLLDRAFSREATEERLNNYNIIHLATHGAFVPGQPEESFILFGNGDRATLRDVESWNLKNVDLVVLSACQTGVSGQLGNGEEILGLGYQMQQAGALATIASLWVVDDQGTQVLMDAFYRALQERNAKAEALRQAQIALINSDYKHPYYWAPFILIGNGL